MPSDEKVATHSIRFCLPDDAAQGPKHWYILHLDLQIEFSEESTEGFCVASADTNGFTCAQIEFNTEREDGELVVDWSSLGLIDGRVRRTTSSTVVDVSFQNYLRTAGVSPGLNTLTFKLETYKGTKVHKFRIIDTSGIEYTTTAPPDWEMKIEIPQSSIEIGDTFSVDFEIENSGGWSIEQASVQADYPQATLALVGDDELPVPRLEDSARGSFKFKALAEGPSEITLLARTHTNVPPQLVGTIMPVVGESPHTHSTGFPLISAILGPIGFAFVGYGIRRFFKNRRDHYAKSDLHDQE